MPTLMNLYERHLYAVFKDDSGHIPTEKLGNTWEAKILYCSLSALPLLMTIYLFWRRLRSLGWRDMRHLSYIRCFVYLSYLSGIAFFITSISLAATGLRTEDSCRTAIYFCIGFLFSGKLCLQIFLIERAHVANINYLRRRDDPIWIASSAAAFLGGAALIIWAFLNPVAFLARKDGKCHKGLPTAVVAPVEVFEFILNVVLTTVFVVMLRRTRQCELFPKVPEQFTTVKSAITQLRKKTNITKPSPEVEQCEVQSSSASVILPPSSRPSRLHNLAYKSLIGTILILLMGVANSTIFYVTNGKERMELCFSQCTGEIFLSICVLHWLTTNHREDEQARVTRLSVAELPTFLLDSVIDVNDVNDSEKAARTFSIA